jgi:hypothetical protein
MTTATFFWCKVSIITSLIVCSSSVALGQRRACSLPCEVRSFLDQVPRSGRGPSREFFGFPAATELAYKIVESKNSGLGKCLSIDQREELRQRIFLIDSYQPIPPACESMLASIDLRDRAYEQALADVFQKCSARRLAVELLEIEGLSAIRRPLVACALSINAKTSDKIAAAVSPHWENAVSLQRLMFTNDGTDRAELAEIKAGLDFHSRSADEAVLTVLRVEEINCLAKLLAERSGDQQ